MDLLPGLRQVATVPVATLSATSLLNRLSVDAGSLLLMLDAPGSELEILQSFKEAGALDVLVGLDLICSEEPQYQGSLGRPDLQSWVEAEGFSLAATDASDPDWPRLSFRIDHKARKIGSLTAELAEMDDARKASEDQISALQAKLAAAETAASISAAESAKEIADLRERILAADEALATAIKDNAQNNARQTAEYSSLEADRNSLAVQLEAANTNSHDLAAQLDELGMAVAQHLADLDTQSTATRAVQTRADGLAVRVAELELSVADLSQLLAEADGREQSALQETAQLRAELDAALTTKTALEQHGHTLAEKVAGQAATIAELMETAAQVAMDLHETKTLSETRHQSIIELEAEVKTKVATLAEAERELSSRAERLSEMENASLDLSNRVADVARQLGEREATLAETHNTLAIRTNERTAAEERADALGKQVAELEVALKAAQSETAEKGEWLAKQVNWTKHLEADLAETRKTLVTRAEEKAAAGARIEALGKEVADLESALHTAQADASDKGEWLAKQVDWTKHLETELAEMRTSLANRTAEKTVAEERIVTLSKRVADLESTLQTAQADAADKAGWLTKQVEWTKHLEAELAETRNSLNSRTAEKAAADERSETLGKQVADLAASLQSSQSETAAVAESLSRQEEMTISLEADLTETRSTLANRTAEKAAADERVEMLSIQAAELESTLQTVQADAADKGGWLAKQVEWTKHLETELDETRSTLVATRSEKAASDEQVEMLTKHLADLEAAIDTAQADAAAKEESLTKQTARTTDLEFSLAQARIEDGLKLARIAELDATIEDQRAQVSAQDARVAGLDAVLSELRVAHATQTDALSLATQQINELKERLSNLETRLANSLSEAALSAERATSQAERIKELEFRRDLTRDELRRSEGQLTLIKDLLLRGDRP
jgi:chromosome segregation ATPase